MTVVAVKDNIMAADGAVVSGSQVAPLSPLDQKIVRLPDGSLVGAAGSARECWQLAVWCRAGMPADHRPVFSCMDADKDEAVDWLWLKMDGSLWRGGPELRPYPVSQPYTIGCYAAGLMAHGAMIAGKSAEDAVRVIIPHCRNVGLPVQVEALAPLVEPVG
jgi:hypothetical protein